MTRSIYYVSKQKKANHTHMCSSVQIAKVTIRQILTYIHSENIGSTGNGITKSILRSMKTKPSQFTMICNVLKLFSQNVHKNSLIINTILETQTSFDIIFIQEPSWSIIWSIPSSTSCEEEELVGVPYHSNWLTFTRSPTNQSDLPRVLIYA